MRVLLIAPPMTIYNSDLTIPGYVVPLGISYIASYARERARVEGLSINVRILDCLAEGHFSKIQQRDRIQYGLSDEQILERIVEYKPDVVGVSCQYTAYAADAHNVCRLIKSYNPNIRVVLGGAHCSISPLTELKDRNVDAVVFGEGEETFYELLHAYETGGVIDHIAGTAVRKKDGKILQNVARGYLKNLDLLPHPARDLLAMDVYLGVGMGASNLMRKPATTMITSRGCPYQCSFCSIHAVWGYGWRPRSPENVVDEIEHLRDKYGIREIHFLDDNIGINRDRMKGICKEIIRRDVDISWTTPNGIAHWLLNGEILSLMKASGCYRITLGVESGSENTRAFIGKDPAHGISLGQAEKIIRYANKIGLWTISTFILGFPYEKLEDIQETINFAIRSDLDLAVFYLAGPFPGTKLYDVAKVEGLLDWDFSDVYDASMHTVDYSEIGRALGAGGMDTKYFTHEELQSLQAYAFKRFFTARIRRNLNPIRMSHKVKNLEEAAFAIRALRGLAGPIFESVTGKNRRVAPQTINRQAARSLAPANEVRPHIQNA